MALKNRLALTAVVIFIIALAPRLAHLSEVRSSPFFDSPVVGARRYDYLAVAIAEGDLVGSQLFWQAPLYQYFLALVYYVFGHSLLVPRILQVLIGSVSCVLIYLLGVRVFGFGVGVIAGVISAFYGLFVFFDGELLRPTIVIFLNLLLLHLILLAGERKKNILWFASGLLLGLSAVAKPTILLFAPFVLAWMLVKDGGVGTASACLIFVLGAGLIILPVTVRNIMVGGEFFFISSNFGVNFYLGNNPSIEETLNVRWGLQWERFLEEPVKNGFISYKQQSDYWLKKSLSYIKNDPISYAKLLAYKTYMFWNSYEIGRNQDIYFLTRYSQTAKALVWRSPITNFPFGVIAPLSLVGMMLALPRLRDNMLLYFYVFSGMTAVVMFFVCSRHRLSTAAVLVVFAAYTLWWWSQRFTAREYKKILPSVVLFLLLFVVVNSGWKMNAWNKTDYANAHWQIGFSLKEKGLIEDAVKEYEKSIGYNQDYVDAHWHLGLSYIELGRFDAAADEMNEVLRIEPDFKAALDVIDELQKK